MKKLAIYIHIPFCKQKCKYCDFNSFVGKINLEKMYVEAALREIDSYGNRAEDFSVTSVYFGGGTPSFIGGKFIERIMKKLCDVFIFDTNMENTIEVNPGTIDEEKLRLYKNIGINRVSFGVQALQDTVLKKIGRIHSVEEVFNGYDLARKTGFKNISLDLMFGLPQQSLDDVEKTVDGFIEMAPEHISAYSLKVEENTEFGRLQKSSNLILPDEVLEREMYYLIKKKLKDNGFMQYEISNFAKEGYESKHNLAYWKRQDYLGFGAGAASCFNEVRFSNETNLEKYIELSPSARVYEEKLSPDIIKTEKIILGLRLLEGIDESLFIKHKWKLSVEKLCKFELLQKEEGRVRLTDKGLDLANQVFVEFM